MFSEIYEVIRGLYLLTAELMQGRGGSLNDKSWREARNFGPYEKWIIYFLGDLWIFSANFHTYF
jgi:hypothetical protein